MNPAPKPEQLYDELFEEFRQKVWFLEEKVGLDRKDVAAGAKERSGNLGDYLKKKKKASETKLTKMLAALNETYAVKLKRFVLNQNQSTPRYVTRPIKDIEAQSEGSYPSLKTKVEELEVDIKALTLLNLQLLAHATGRPEKELKADLEKLKKKLKQKKNP